MNEMTTTRQCIPVGPKKKRNNWNLPLLTHVDRLTYPNSHSLSPAGQREGGRWGKNRNRRNVWSLRTTSVWRNFVTRKLHFLKNCLYVRRGIMFNCSTDAHCAAEWAWKFSPDKKKAFSRKCIFSCPSLTNTRQKIANKYYRQNWRVYHV